MPLPTSFSDKEKFDLFPLWQNFLNFYQNQIVRRQDSACTGTQKFRFVWQQETGIISK
jgi:hypothetical protein